MRAWNHASRTARMQGGKARQRVPEPDPDGSRAGTTDGIGDPVRRTLADGRSYRSSRGRWNFRSVNFTSSSGNGGAWVAMSGCRGRPEARSHTVQYVYVQYMHGTWGWLAPGGEPARAPCGAPEPGPCSPRKRSKRRAPEPAAFTEGPCAPRNYYDWRPHGAARPDGAAPCGAPEPGPCSHASCEDQARDPVSVARAASVARPRSSISWQSSAKLGRSAGSSCLHRIARTFMCPALLGVAPCAISAATMPYIPRVFSSTKHRIVHPSVGSTASEKAVNPLPPFTAAHPAGAESEKAGSLPRTVHGRKRTRDP